MNNNSNKNNSDRLTQKPIHKQQTKIEEIGGPKGPEPTRYSDWEVKGRVSDF